MGCSISTNHNFRTKQHTSTTIPQQRSDPLPSIDGLIIKKSDFIKENKGEFRQCYKVGRQLGTGIFNNMRCIWRGKKM
jgi:hypothetical protein